MRLGSRETTGWRATVVRGDVQLHRSRLDHRDRGEPDPLAGGVRGRRLRGRPARRRQRERVRRGGGAIVGGWLCDRYGRKFIYTYDLLIYMAGVLLAAFAVSYGMLLAGFLLTGLAVGAGVPASWTSSPRRRRPTGGPGTSGTAQLAWSIGPMVGFALAIAVVPLGLLGSRLIFAAPVRRRVRDLVAAAGPAASPAWTEEQEEPRQPRLRAACASCSSERANITALLFLFGVYGFWNLVAGQAGIFMPRVYDAAGVSSPAGQNAPAGPGLVVHRARHLVRASCAAPTA